MSVEASTALELFDRIVCAVDGTPESLEAARQAERLRSHGGKLGVTAVADVNTAVLARWAMSHVLEGAGRLSPRRAPPGG